MEDCDADRKKDNSVIQGGFSHQNSHGDESRLKIGERYLVRRHGDTWRKYTYACSLKNILFQHMYRIFSVKMCQFRKFPVSDLSFSEMLNETNWTCI